MNRPEAYGDQLDAVADLGILFRSWLWNLNQPRADDLE